jgi:hypothetical protein
MRDGSLNFAHALLNAHGLVQCARSDLVYHLPLRDVPRALVSPTLPPPAADIFGDFKDRFKPEEVVFECKGGGRLVVAPVASDAER